VARALAAFDLESWQRWGMPRARHNIAGSGVAVQPLTDLGLEPDFWQRAWATTPDELTAKLQSTLARTFGGKPEEFAVCLGASEADFAVAMALLGPGENAVIEQPAYFALLEPARALGAAVTRVAWGAETGHPPTSQAFIDRLDARTRLVAFARPHNPTGARMPDGELVRLAEAAQRMGAHVLVDEVFADATPAGDVPAARLHPAILSANSITKCLGFGPLQVGWVQGPADVVAQVRAAKWHVRPMMASLDMALAARVLEHRSRILAVVRARRSANVATVHAFVERTGIAWTGAGEGTTVMVKAPAADDRAFAKRLLEREGVLVAPGSTIEMPGWVRVGLLTAPDVLAAGLDGLARALKS